MKTLVLQDIVLNQVRRERAAVTALLCTGDKITGKVRGFDNFTVIFDAEDGGQVLAYKHSIAGIFLKDAVLTDEKQQKNNKT